MAPKLKRKFKFALTKTLFMIYKFRAILDNEDDIFRDIAINQEDTLEDFHNALFNAFGFNGLEVASFYTCDDTWNQDQEIPMFDTGDEPGEIKTMADYVLEDILDKQNTKIIYVYDFINMWTFLVELASIENEVVGETYPNLLFSHGIMPEESGDKVFESDFDENSISEFEDDYDEDDLDMLDGGENFEDFGFEENWN